MAQHFFRLLKIFLIMVILGLIGLVLVNSFGPLGGDTIDTGNQVPVAK